MTQWSMELKIYWWKCQKTYGLGFHPTGKLGYKEKEEKVHLDPKTSATPVLKDCLNLLSEVVRTVLIGEPLSQESPLARLA